MVNDLAIFYHEMLLPNLLCIFLLFMEKHIATIKNQLVNAIAAK